MARGKDPARYRTQAFALGGALMGLAGAIGAPFIGFTAPENYQSILTFQIWTMLILGGSGNIAGAPSPAPSWSGRSGAPRAWRSARSFLRNSRRAPPRCASPRLASCSRQ